MPVRSRRPWVIRLAIWVVVFYCIGAIHERAVTIFGRERDAGFGSGLWHGAIMPLALPQLLFGRDLPIYAETNSGRIYKLGYTLGVNGCGALFFGIFFWRVRSLRARVSSARRGTVGRGSDEP